MLWQSWPGPGYPSTKKQEEELISQIKNLVDLKGPVQWSRSDITNILSILRSGSTLKEVQEVAPGIVFGSLLAGYEHLDSLRKAAVTAIEEGFVLAEEGEWSDAVGQEIFKISQPLCKDLKTLAKSRKLSADHRYDEIQLIRKNINATAKLALDIEDRLSELPKKELNKWVKRLYDPYGDGLWGSGYFIPKRIGVLVPLQVTLLLGDRGVSRVRLSGEEQLT
jgi:hypothetical protein